MLISFKYCKWSFDILETYHSNCKTHLYEMLWGIQAVRGIWYSYRGSYDVAMVILFSRDVKLRFIENRCICFRVMFIISVNTSTWTLHFWNGISIDNLWRLFRSNLLLSNQRWIVWKLYTHTWIQHQIPFPF